MYEKLRILYIDLIRIIFQVETYFNIGILFSILIQILTNQIWKLGLYLIFLIITRVIF